MDISADRVITSLYLVPELAANASKDFATSTNNIEMK